GVGSAVNDTTRQVGGAVGVAVVGSVFASIYGSKVVDLLATRDAPAQVIAAAKQSIAAVVPGPFAAPAKVAFVDGFHAGLYVGAGVLLVGLTAVLLWLPARARTADVDRQHAEWEAARV
ncbi:MAG: MFS transporter, partial [Dehalococcoidia bacterium]